MEILRNLFYGFPDLWGGGVAHSVMILALVITLGLLDKLGFEWGKSLVHFSYGMVELPEGKMKSREGTVVDADDLMAEMIATAKEDCREVLKCPKCRRHCTYRRTGSTEILYP